MKFIILIAAIMVCFAPSIANAEYEISPTALRSVCSPMVELRKDVVAVCDHYIAGVLDMAKAIRPIVQQGICIPPKVRSGGYTLDEFKAEMAKTAARKKDIRSAVFIYLETKRLISSAELSRQSPPNAVLGAMRKAFPCK